MTQIPEQDLAEVKAIADINGECDRRYPQLKHQSITAYIGKVVDAIYEKRIGAAVVIVDNIHPNRLDGIREALKDYKAKMPTEVLIRFLDGGMLRVKFDKKDGETATH